MSDIDFQNGFLCGLATRGLTKANVDLSFLNDHKYYFVSDTLNIGSIIDSLNPITDTLTDAEVVETNVKNSPAAETLNIDEITSYILTKYNDNVSEEL
jgi:hypothetical protein